MIYQDTSDSNFEGETAKPTWSIVILDGIQITSWFDMLKGKGLLGVRRLYLCGCCSSNLSGAKLNARYWPYVISKVSKVRVWSRSFDPTDSID